MARRMRRRLVRVRIRFGPDDLVFGNKACRPTRRLLQPGGGEPSLSISSLSFCLSGLGEVNCLLELWCENPFCRGTGEVGVAGSTLTIVWVASPKKTRPRCTRLLLCWLIDSDTVSGLGYAGIASEDVLATEEPVEDGPAITVSMKSPPGAREVAAAAEGRLEVEADVLVAVNVGDGGLNVLPPVKLREFSTSSSSMASPRDSSNGCILGVGLAAGDSGGVGGFSIALYSILRPRVSGRAKTRRQRALDVVAVRKEES